MIGCLLISNTNHLEAKGRLRRALAGTFLGGIAGGAVGFGIGVLTVIGAGVCCPCCILIPVIGSSVLGIGAGAASGGIVGAVTAKSDTKTDNTPKKTKKKKKRQSKKTKKQRSLKHPKIVQTLKSKILKSYKKNPHKEAPKHCAPLRPEETRGVFEGK